MGSGPIKVAAPARALHRLPDPRTRGVADYGTRPVFSTPILQCAVRSILRGNRGLRIRLPGLRTPRISGKRPSKKVVWSLLALVTGLVVSGLILLSVGLEIHHYWTMPHAHDFRSTSNRMYEQFSYSAWFMTYGAILPRRRLLTQALQPPALAGFILLATSPSPRYILLVDVSELAEGATCILCFSRPVHCFAPCQLRLPAHWHETFTNLEKGGTREARCSGSSARCGHRIAGDPLLPNHPPINQHPPTRRPKLPAARCRNLRSCRTRPRRPAPLSRRHGNALRHSHRRS